MEKTNKLSKRTGFCCNTLHTDRRILYVPPLKVSVVRVLLTNVRGGGTMAAPVLSNPGGARPSPPPPCNDAYAPMDITAIERVYSCPAK